MSESDKSGKPELSSEDIARIEKAADKRYPDKDDYNDCRRNAGFRNGAEWVYSTNVLPLRARIAELEATLHQKEMEFTQLLAEFKDKQP